MADAGRLVTATRLRDMVICERLVHNDLHGDPSARDPASGFVEMLRELGLRHEARVVSGLDGEVVDLRAVPLADRAAATRSAMAGAADWILGGRLQTARVVGMPDLLRRHGGVWTAGDVKAGGALDADGRRPLLEYAVQVGCYAMALGELDLGDASRAFVIDGDGATVWYDLDAPWAKDGRPLAAMVAGLVAAAEGVRDGTVATRGALSAACKMCQWRTACTAELAAAGDLTLVAALGRSLREAIEPVAPDVAALAALDLGALARPGGRTAVPGVGLARLSRFRDRARLLCTPGARPYALRPLGLARATREFHLDVESVPDRGGTHVYLHGVLERTLDGAPDRFHAFFDEDAAAGGVGERRAFAGAMALLASDPAAPVYYYSRYERTCYRELQRRYPDACSADDVEALFDPARSVDLLSDVVMPMTEWPCRDLSIKTLAKFLGFAWRDADASGAASITWFTEWARTRDAALLTRILEYNHDDVRASAVLLDGLIALPVRKGPEWPPVQPPAM